MTTSIDKLLNYLFDQNGVLIDQLAGVSEDLCLQKEQAERHHRDLKSSLTSLLPINMDLSVNNY